MAMNGTQSEAAASGPYAAYTHAKTKMGGLTNRSNPTVVSLRSLSTSMPRDSESMATAADTRMALQKYETANAATAGPPATWVVCKRVFGEISISDTPPSAL